MEARIRELKVKEFREGLALYVDLHSGEESDLPGARVLLKLVDKNVKTIHLHGIGDDAGRGFVFIL